MKRNIATFLLSLPFLLTSCIIDQGEESGYNEAYIAQYTDALADGRFEFPIAMMETVLNIEAYEKASPEEKMQMTYIFNSLIKNETGYSMKNFHNFELTVDGNSIYEVGARWKFAATDGRGDRYPFTMTCVAPGVWDVGYLYENDGLTMTVRSIEEDNVLFSWEIEVSGFIRSDEGRYVSVGTEQPIIRKIFTDPQGYDWCRCRMEGEFHVTIFERRGGRVLESRTRIYDGTVSRNTYYQF